ncbi:MAG: OsmC family protein [Microbacteriaceae bacterium]|nr:OsmC family protein [Microbacteriaceae bacterium]
MTADKHAALVASAAEGFGGDVRLWNPEELLMAAIAQCHMLSFLYAAHEAGIDIVDYVDETRGTMNYQGGKGSMTNVTLRLTITTTASAVDVERLHDEAKELCVMRASVNFPILIESVTVLPDATIN